MVQVWVGVWVGAYERAIRSFDFGGLGWGRNSGGGRGELVVSTATKLERNKEIYVPGNWHQIEIRI